MSWDIFIQDLPPVARVEDIPADFQPRCIGERETILATIRRVLPMAEQQDTDWLFAKGENIDLSLQLHMEDDTQVRYIVLHVEGGSLSAPAVAALLRQLDLRALDTATGDLFDAATLEEGL
jgi:hypothetical protein